MSIKLVNKFSTSNYSPITYKHNFQTADDISLSFFLPAKNRSCLKNNSVHDTFRNFRALLNIFCFEVYGVHRWIIHGDVDFAVWNAPLAWRVLYEQDRHSRSDLAVHEGRSHPLKFIFHTRRFLRHRNCGVLDDIRTIAISHVPYEHRSIFHPRVFQNSPAPFFPGEVDRDKAIEWETSTFNEISAAKHSTIILNIFPYTEDWECKIFVIILNGWLIRQNVNKKVYNIIIGWKIF